MANYTKKLNRETRITKNTKQGICETNKINNNNNNNNNNGILEKI
jgi:hypothetical protein